MSWNLICPSFMRIWQEGLHIITRDKLGEHLECFSKLGLLLWQLVVTTAVDGTAVCCTVLLNQSWKILFRDKPLPESGRQNKPVFSQGVGMKQNVGKQINSSWPLKERWHIQAFPEQAVLRQIIIPRDVGTYLRGRFLRQFCLQPSLSPASSRMEWFSPQCKGILNTRKGFIRRLDWKGPFRSSK